MKLKYLITLFLLCIPLVPVYAGQNELPPGHQLVGTRIRYNSPNGLMVSSSEPCYILCAYYTTDWAAMSGTERAEYVSGFKVLLYINDEPIRFRKWVHLWDNDGTYTWESTYYYIQFEPYDFTPGTYTFRFDYYLPKQPLPYVNEVTIIFT